MYYEAIAACFDRIPMDPPGALMPGQYVRVGRRQVRLFGDLRDLLDTTLEVQRNTHELEYFSKSATKTSLSGSQGDSAQAEICFAGGLGLYIAGKRTTVRLMHLHGILNQLAHAPVDWNVRFRIVTEVQEVEQADIFCSNHGTARLRVAYQQDGMPVVVSAQHERGQSDLLHLPNLTGTIAFGAIRYVKFLNIMVGATAGPAYEYRELDVNDSADMEDEIDDESSP